jgi:hypothetical protein
MLPATAFQHTKEDQLLRDLAVPFLLTENSIDSPEWSFTGNPIRYGLDREATHQPEACQLAPERVPVFLQEWLFFGGIKAVSNVLQVAFNAKDFVTRTDSGELIVSGQPLQRYLWLWDSALLHKTLDEHRACLHELKIHLNIINKTINAWTVYTWADENLDLGRVLLSVVLLWETITHAIFNMVADEIRDEVFGIKYRWILPSFGYKLLIKTGWCVGELPRLLRECPVTVLFYLSGLDRRKPYKNHETCSEKLGCFANHIDNEKYAPQHSDECASKGCGMVDIPIEEVTGILQSGDIPVIRITNDVEKSQSLIEVQTFKLATQVSTLKYVAISHVWSHGMGNPHQNSLWKCQLLRVQQAVDAISLAQKSSEHTLFWLDTLCVPLEPIFRNLAIVRMSATYLHAHQVLVLDSWLCQQPDQLLTRNLLLKIAHSDWSTRLWTFQESILARKPYFQLLDRAISIDTFDDAAKYYKNLESVSHSLSELPTSELCKDQQYINLLRGLTCIDFKYIEDIKRYAALGVQSDPEQEEYRVIALNNLDYVDSQQEIFNLWYPVLQSIVPPVLLSHEDSGYRTHLESRTLDSIFRYALATFNRLRGSTYQVVVRENFDRRFQDSRRASPSSLLSFVARGLVGRTTSKIEDETICLAAIIHLDVAKLLEVKAPKDLNRRLVTNYVRISRMKKFLALLEQVPKSILFWEVSRINQTGWKWAPVSFLHAGAAVDMTMVGGTALRTTDGLLASYSGVRLNLQPEREDSMDDSILQVSFINTEYSNEEKLSHIEFRKTWQLLRICPSNASPSQSFSWLDCARNEDWDLALILHGRDGLEAVLVRILRTSGDITFASYLSNVTRLHRDYDRNGTELRADGTWITMQQWCVE